MRPDQSIFACRIGLYQLRSRIKYCSCRRRKEKTGPADLGNRRCKKFVKALTKSGMWNTSSVNKKSLPELFPGGIGESLRRQISATITAANEDHRALKVPVLARLRQASQASLMNFSDLMLETKWRDGGSWLFIHWILNAKIQPFFRAGQAQLLNFKSG